MTTEEKAQFYLERGDLQIGSDFHSICQGVVDSSDQLAKIRSYCEEVINAHASSTDRMEWGQTETAFQIAKLAGWNDLVSKVRDAIEHLS